MADDSSRWLSVARVLLTEWQWSVLEFVADMSALMGRPVSTAGVRKAVDGPPGTKVNNMLNRLRDLGLVDRDRQGRSAVWSCPTWVADAFAQNMVDALGDAVERRLGDRSIEDA